MRRVLRWRGALGLGEVTRFERLQSTVLVWAESILEGLYVAMRLVEILD